MQNFAFEISRTRALVNQFLACELARRGYPGLAPSHGDILAQLCHSEGERMSELSRRIDRDPSTVTALVRKLVKLGYAETARDKDDGRAVVVSLTDRGRALERDFTEISDLLRSTWVDGVDPGDVDAAVRVLAGMRANLRTAIESGSRRAPDETAPPCDTSRMKGSTS